MTIGSHAITFEGRDVVEYDPETGITQPQKHAYVLRWSWNDETPFEEKWNTLLKDPNHSQLEALILGVWDEEMYDSSTQVLVDLLVEAACEFPKLEALFFPDVTYEETEISWINQTNVSPILEAYPQLQALRVRGGNDLAFSKVRHTCLRRLMVETGGLSASTVSQIGTLNLPNLEHLELWLGTENYGGDASVDELAPILSGKLFPKLTFLGLMNSEFANDIALNLAGAPVLEQIEVLDLSMGTMTNEGAEHLLTNPVLKTLKRLDVSDNFLSDAMKTRLGDVLGDVVVVGDQKSDDGDGWYYTSVSE